MHPLILLFIQSFIWPLAPSVHFSSLFPHQVFYFNFLKDQLKKKEKKKTPPPKQKLGGYMSPVKAARSSWGFIKNHNRFSPPDTYLRW